MRKQRTSVVAMTDVTFGDLCRTAPHRAVLFTGLPLAVAAVQLLNTAFNGLSPWISVPVALVMVSASVLLTQLQLAHLARRRLVGEAVAPSGEHPAD